MFLDDAASRQAPSLTSVRRFTRAGSALTLVAEVPGERVAALQEYLRELGEHVRDNGEYAFTRLETVHFMRWVVLARGKGVGHDYLLFESNYDGTLDEHLLDLLAAGPRALRHIYGHCAGMPGDSASEAEFLAALRQRARPYLAFYGAYRNKPAARVTLEQRVRASLQRAIDQHEVSLRGKPAREVYRVLRDHAEAAGLLRELAAVVPEPPRRSALSAGLHALPGLLGFLMRSVVVVPALLVKERRDVPLEIVSSAATQAEADVPALKQLRRVSADQSGRARVLERHA